MTVSFKIGILPNRPFRECVDLCVAAEKLGFGGVWVADSQSVMRDAYALLSVVGAKTDRIRIASGITNARTRHLAVLAASWATLDELSGGRAVMGIGVGESSVRNIGLKPDRLADLEAKINVLRLLMRGEEATHDGETFHLTWAKREVPIFMACSGPKSLQMGGRVADGVLFQVGSEPSFVQYALDNIRLGAEQAGRGLEDIKLFMRLACDVSEDRDKSRERWMRRSRDSRRSQIWESMVSFVRREWMTRWKLSRSRISDGGVQDYVTSTLNSVRRGAELTKQLLTFSSNQDLNVTHVDLNELVLCMQGMLQRTLGEDISVKTNLCGDVWQVMADEGQVENALLNL